MIFAAMLVVVLCLCAFYVSFLWFLFNDRDYDTSERIIVSIMLTLVCVPCILIGAKVLLSGELP